MQDIIVYFIVAGAAFYVGRGWYRSSREGGGGCGGCKSNKNGGCASKTEAEKPLVQIDLDASWKR